MTEVNATRIMGIYGHFEAEVGKVLNARHILAVGARRRWEPRELQDGVRTAEARTWIRRASHGWELTREGHDAMLAAEGPSDR